MKLSPLENSFQLLTDLVSDMRPNSDEPVSPALSIFEHDDRYIIECDLPGVTLKDISLEIHDGVLEISGERRQPDLAEGTSVRFDERIRTPFRRRIKLHKSVDTAAVNADYDNGILSVTAPRLPETLPQKISIRTASDA